MSRPEEELSIGTLVFIAQRAYEEEIVEALHAQGFTFTLAQGRLAARVAENGSRLTELADAAGITKQSAAALLKQIELLGLVSKTPDPRDARAQIIMLTDYGRSAQRTAREIEAEIQSRWQKMLGKEKFDALAAILTELREHVDRHRPRGLVGSED